MDLGLVLMTVRPDRVPGVAAHAEEVGYESVFLTDHPAIPIEFESRYPGTPTGDFPYPHDLAMYDPWILHAQVAQVTSSIKLGTAIYQIAMRHPIVSARILTTLDTLSNGRVLVGVGGGWLVEEFEALGVNPKTRFSRLEETIEAIRVLWTEDEAEYHGNHFDFGPVGFQPKPKPVPPILVGGYADSALRRAIRLGDGWLSGGGAKLDDVAALMKRIDELKNEMEIDKPFPITILDTKPEPALVAGLAELGVDRLVVLPWTRGREAFAEMESFYEMAQSVT